MASRPKQFVWQISLIKSKAVQLGEVIASDDPDAAIRAAVKEFSWLTPSERQRLVARKVRAAR